MKSERMVKKRKEVKIKWITQKESDQTSKQFIEACKKTKRCLRKKAERDTSNNDIRSYYRAMRYFKKGHKVRICAVKKDEILINEDEAIIERRKYF